MNPTDKAGMNPTDKGIRKALRGSPQLRLPSNFTYLTLRRIEEEQCRRERLHEKWLFIAMVATCCLMVGGLAFAGCWFYGEELADGLHQTADWLQQLLSNGLTLPLLLPLPLLWVFNRVLKRKFEGT